MGRWDGRSCISTNTRGCSRGFHMNSEFKKGYLQAMEDAAAMRCVACAAGDIPDELYEGKALCFIHTTGTGKGDVLCPATKMLRRIKEMTSD